MTGKNGYTNGAKLGRIIHAAISERSSWLYLWIAGHHWGFNITKCMEISQEQEKVAVISKARFHCTSIA